MDQGSDFLVFLEVLVFEFLDLFQGLIGFLLSSLGFEFERVDFLVRREERIRNP